MVVGKKDKGDIKLKRDAMIKLKGKSYDKNVYSDKKYPKTRTVFAPSNGRLPKSTQVNWMGDKYKAKLSFRTGIKNSKIPVYEWKVKSRAKK